MSAQDHDTAHRHEHAKVARSMLVLAVTGIVLCGHQAQLASSPDDLIRPSGHKRSRAEIVSFMESEVMPFARSALEPVVGRGKVWCGTCHGENAMARDWRMPAVSALPEPAVRGTAATAGSDSQLRNALHGYLAGENQQRKAAHMRGVVLPGMAALLRRPVYDFVQTYEFNLSRSAFGCYHCHLVED
jgi:hypothetical protein